MNNDIMGPNPSYSQNPGSQPAALQPQPQPQPQPVVQQAPVRRGGGKKVFKFLLVLILIAAAGAGAYFYQNKQVKDLNAKVSDLQNTNNSLSGQIGSLNQQLQNQQSPQAVSYEGTLPNGKKISYPLNATNATVLWWYAQDKTAKNNGNVLYLSSSKMVQFLTTVPSTVLATACPNEKVTDFNAKSLTMGTIDTTTQTLAINFNKNYTNCVEQLQTNTTYGADAKKTVTAVKADLTAFAKDLKIQ